MNLVGDLFMLAGALVAVLAGVGLIKFESNYARFHAAGKASPIAYLVAAIGAAFTLGWTGGAMLITAGIAMVLTLPVGVHLLFRATYRTTAGDHLSVDELAAEAEHGTES